MTFQKLVLIANYEPDRQQSMQRFARALERAFAGKNFAVEVWRPEARFSKLWPGGYRYAGVPKYLGYLDKFFLFPRALRRRARAQPRGTVYHILDHANAVYAPHLGDAPVVVSVHDLLQIRSALGEFPQRRLSASGARYQRWILKNLSRLRLAVCISRKTRDDFLRLTALPTSHARIVEMSLNYPYRRMSQTEAAPLLGRIAPIVVGEPYFINVCGAQWYKNRTGLIEIFAALRGIAATAHHKLLYVGPEFDAEQLELIERHALGGAVVRVRDLENEELNAAYSLARALIFPSWEEGFGWPVAEAQACGCPVFTTNRAPMTEVGGGGASYIDPANPVAAAEHIARTLADDGALAQLREAGAERTEYWRARNMADDYEKIYCEAAEGMA